MENCDVQMYKEGKLGDGGLGGGCKACQRPYCNSGHQGEKGKQWEKALRLLQRMTCRALALNEISNNAGISACDKGKRWEGSPATAAADDLQGA